MGSKKPPKLRWNSYAVSLTAGVEAVLVANSGYQATSCLNISPYLYIAKLCAGGLLGLRSSWE